MSQTRQQRLAEIDGRIGQKTSVAYDNLANLKLQRPADGTFARTRGYYAKNDGGGANYYFDSSSTATDDGGSVLLPTTGTGAGRWLYIPPMSRIVNAKQFGSKGMGDGTDDTTSLQNGINYIVDRSLRFYIPSGNYKTTAKLSVGAANPASYPWNHSSFEIFGDGPPADPNNFSGSNLHGTMIVLYGTGHSAVLEINHGAYAYNKYCNFALRCATEGGAQDGFSWSSTGFTQHRLEQVHSIGAKKAFAIRTGAKVNGEFVSFIKCYGFGQENFFFMDGVGLNGQSFGHYFEHCLGSVNDGGAGIEIGGGNGGYNMTVIESAISMHYNRTPGDPQNIDENFQTWTSGATYLKNNGVTGTINIIGGRNETINTIVKTTQNSYNLTGRIFFKGTVFEGMSSLLTRPSLKSTGSNSGYSYSFEDCYFSGFNYATTNASWIVDLATGDASQYVFTRCEFDAFKHRSNGIGRDSGSLLAYVDCGQSSSGGAPIRFTKRFQWRQHTEEAIGSGKPDNILLQSGFRATSGGGGTLANAPWQHYGTTPSFENYVFPDSSVSPFTTSPDARRIFLQGTSGLYQDITTVDFSGSNVTAFYKAVVQPGWGNKTFVITLENSVSGRIYDQAIIRVPPDQQNSADSKMYIQLHANDGGTTGVLRLRIYNASTDGGGAFWIHKQWVSTSASAAFVPTTTTARSLTHVWSGSPESLRIGSRLQIPFKDDTYGVSNTLPDIAAGEVYFSATGGFEYIYDGTRWNTRPKQDIGTAAPTTGTWQQGFIRWAASPSASGKIGWVCVTGGTPGTWKPFGAIDA